jgi:hypothetical protein
MIGCRHRPRAPLWAGAASETMPAIGVRTRFPRITFGYARHSAACAQGPARQIDVPARVGVERDDVRRGAGRRAEASA